MKHAIASTLAALLGLTACGSDDALQYMDSDDFPAGSCAETDTDACATSGGDTTDPADACLGSDDCPGGSCAAPFVDGQRGGFACAPACIDDLDDTSWCADDAACCDPAARCTSRGYCVVFDTDETGAASSSDSGSGDSGSGDSSSTSE